MQEVGYLFLKPVDATFSAAIVKLTPRNTAKKLHKKGQVGYTCQTSKGTSSEEYCPAKRRRLKRYVAKNTLESDYAGGLYDHFMERDAMENFLNFDLNLDGKISIEEANATLKEFKKVDTNSDGFVQPGELDMSLR